MERDELIALLREKLRIEVQSSSEYNGGMDGTGEMYSRVSTIQLILDDEVISEATL